MRIHFIPILLFILIQPCAASEHPVFGKRDLVRTYGDCGSDSTTCARVELTWPVATAGPSPSVESVNAYIDSVVTVKLAGFVPRDATTADDKEALVRTFFDEFARFTKAFPEAPRRWWISIEGDVVYLSDAVATVRFEVTAFTGGAHPFFEVLYQSFDARSGGRLYAGDIVTDADELTRRAEKKFREMKGIAADSKLSDAGFWFREDTFGLPANVAVVENGLVLYYNPYEIAPWYMGATECVLSLDIIRDIVRPEYAVR